MEIGLPQGDFIVTGAASELVLLVAGGRPPALDWLRRVAKTCPVWAIDRGIDVCRQAAVVPELLIGDADSGSPAAWQWSESLRVPTVRHPVDKDWTDLQLALAELAARRPGATALLTGGLGRRFDHAYSNVFSLQAANASGLQAAGLADETEALFFVAAGQRFTAHLAQSPPVVSLMPMTPVCTAVTSRGVHWPLTDATLTMERPAGICNRLSEGSNRLEISLGSGVLGVYFCWDEAGL